MTFDELIEEVLHNKFTNFTAPLSLFSICESFEHTHTNDSEIRYKIKIKNGNEYDVNLKFYTKDELLKSTKVRKLSADKRDLTVSTGYSDLNKILETATGYSIFVEFNKQGEHKITNDTGMNAFELFVMLRDTVLDAMVKFNTRRIDCIVFRTNKEEHDKRLSLYSKLIKKIMHGRELKTFVDTVTEEGNNIVYVY